MNRATLEYIAILGAGRFENYAVHQLEMIVSLVGTGVNRVKSISTNHSRSLVFDYPGGRRASMLQLQDAPFQASLQLMTGEGLFIGQCTDIFSRLINAMLDFFETGKPPVPKEETLESIALIEAGSKAILNEDTWIAVDNAANRGC